MATPHVSSRSPQLCSFRYLFSINRVIASVIIGFTSFGLLFRFLIQFDNEHKGTSRELRSGLEISSPEEEAGETKI